MVTERPTRSRSPGRPLGGSPAGPRAPRLVRETRSCTPLGDTDRVAVREEIALSPSRPAHAKRTTEKPRELRDALEEVRRRGRIIPANGWPVTLA
ncbi:hypothetical protein NDU88_006566 [Pleurodeles waltl]|uniref:Uncharacterized protein n=1 Tax=Pleurodeles waltl TaxID=8319 RepID=A0AAV7NTU9_PLEWA|nr:hypothetical protein NDU88_006566 [Pleurodeles waltl]